MMTDPIGPRNAESPANAPELTASEKLKRLHGACVDFESVLIQQMFQSMQESLPQGNLVGSGLSGSVYSGFLTQAVAKSMAENRSVGLANQVYRDTIRHNPELKEAYEKAKAEAAEAAASKAGTAFLLEKFQAGAGRDASRNIVQELEVPRPPRLVSPPDAGVSLENLKKADK